MHVAVTAVHHVGVRVEDLEASIRFYEDALGLEVLKRVNLNGAEIAFLAIGNDTECLLELISGRTDHTRSDGLVHHIAFTVDDMDTSLVRLKSLGVETLSPEPIVVWEGKRVLFFRGPNGERLEICER